MQARSIGAFASFLLGVSLVSRVAMSQEFSLRRVQDDSVAFSGTLSEERKDIATAMVVRLADFSELTEPGEYYLEVPETGRSVGFRIGDDVYDGELVNVMLGFYGWRSGVDIEFDAHGVHYQHAAGHTTDALLDYVDEQVGVEKDGTGGWYDAGDYGKYLPTASISVNTLLAAWELFGARLEQVELPFIPEHGGELPDFLDEVKWELDWLLKTVYDDGSGRVHHKLNSPSFPGFVLPADDPTTRYFSNYSTAATAEFVATMAKAARAFAPYDDVTSDYSKKLLAAARLSYEYLSEHPDDSPYDASVLAAGAYQKGDAADRLWAAAELWETTGDEAVLQDFEQRILASTRFVENFDWDTTTNFGLLAYTLSQRSGRDEAILEQLRGALEAVAATLVAIHARGGYGRDTELYYWGTNGVVARTCMLLQSAYALDPNPAYLDVCADQIGYLYGRNQYNRSQVTGAGIDPPLNPHHRISGADAAVEPYPGLLVGGGETAIDWRDVQSSFSTNEVAINWNSALVFALAGFVKGGEVSNPLGRGAVSAADCGVRLNSIGYLPGRAKVATVQAECELPSTFKCELPAHTMGGKTDGAPSTIDDLEDGDVEILARDGREGTWFAFDDASGGTRTDPEIAPAERDGSRNALCLDGSNFTRWGGGFGFPLSGVGVARLPYDASNYTGVSFWARGSSTQFRFMLVDKYSDPTASLCSGCNDHFNFSFTPSADWQKFTFGWREARQIGFGDPQPSVCPAALYAFQAQWPSNQSFELCLDDIAFTTDASFEPPGTEGEPVLVPAGGGCSCTIERGGAERGQALLLLSLLAFFALRRAPKRKRHGGASRS
jgi:endoglucanase